MTRKTAREIAMHMVFQRAFSGDSNNLMNLESISDMGILSELKIAPFVSDENSERYINTVTEGVFANLQEIDGLIDKYSTDRKLNRISAVSLTLLRIAVYEILYMEDVPEKVSVNEAVELAKKYDSEEMPAYINGILGSFLRDKNEKQ